MDNTDDIFDTWNREKKLIANQSDRKIYFQEGEVWWCYIGHSLGNELSGKGSRFTRPILVFKKLNSDTCVCLPLTSQSKEGNWYISIPFQNGRQTVVLNQIRMIHSKRLQRRIGTLSEFLFDQVKEKLRDLLELF